MSVQFGSFLLFNEFQPNPGLNEICQGSCFFVALSDVTYVMQLFTTPPPPSLSPDAHTHTPSLDIILPRTLVKDFNEDNSRVPIRDSPNVREMHIEIHTREIYLND